MCLSSEGSIVSEQLSHESLGSIMLIWAYSMYTNKKKDGPQLSTDMILS